MCKNSQKNTQEYARKPFFIDRALSWLVMVIDKNSKKKKEKLLYDCIQINYS